MPRIAYVTNAPPQAGMGKPAREIAACVTRQGTFAVDRYFLDGAARTLTVNVEERAQLSRFPHPLDVKPVTWWRLARHLPAAGYDLWHFTNQTLSFIPRTPAIVTVYDLIELLDPQERFGRPVARVLYRGVPRARHIICISQYTRKTVQDTYAVPDDRITVIPLGVRRDFTAIPSVRDSLAYQEFLRVQQLTPDRKIILYVGSDHPRKNLPVLARAFAKVRAELPSAVLVKVGDPGLAGGREALLKVLDELPLRDAVRFLPNVGDRELQFLYSIADVFVFPSTFEGFGIPPLEAMACGCPVVCSNATSLPEVVGDAATLCDPDDAGAFARAILDVLTQPSYAATLREKGLQRTPLFYWEGIAERTLEVYQRVLEGGERMAKPSFALRGTMPGRDVEL